MLSKTLQDALNKQIVEELYSANLYMAMAYAMDGLGFSGCAHWLKKQSAEETAHAQEMGEFIIKRGGEVKLGAISAVKGTWKDPLTTFEEAYKHECHISECIHKLLDLAREQDDKPMQSFCWKFVEEQVEEEEVASGIVDMLRNMGNGTIFPLDHALGER